MLRNVCVGLLGLVMFLSTAHALIMSKKVYRVQGKPGSSVELICKADDLPETCKFIRPDNQLVCTKTNEEFDFMDNPACVQDATVKLEDDRDQCRLTIKSLDENLHYGEWTCKLEAWFGNGESKIVVSREKLKESAPNVIVEFFKIFQDDVVNIGKSDKKTYQCGVFSPADKFTPLSTPPGRMTWKLNERILQRSDQYEEDLNGNYFQKLELSPTLDDDEAVLRCELDSGSGDEVTLHVVKLAEASSNDPVHIEPDAEDITIKRKFVASPAPKDFQIYFSVIHDNKKVKIYPEKSIGPYSAQTLQDQKSNNEYSIALKIIKPNELKRKRLDLKLVAEVGHDKHTDVLEVPLTFKFHEQVPEEENNDDGDVEENEEDDSTKEASSSSASLYIIVAIIVVVIALCGVFYCCKRNTPEPRDENPPQEAPARDLKDVEEGKPFLQKGDQSKDSEQTSKNPGSDAPKANENLSNLEKAEQHLMEKLDPDESSDETDAAQTKRINFANTHGTNLTEEHSEISRMADTIRSFEKDDSTPMKEDSKNVQAIPITPEEKRKIYDVITEGPLKTGTRISPDGSEESLRGEVIPATITEVDHKRKSGYSDNDQELSEHDAENTTDKESVEVDPKKNWSKNPLYVAKSTEQETSPKSAENDVTDDTTQDRSSSTITGTPPATPNARTVGTQTPSSHRRFSYDSGAENRNSDNLDPDQSMHA